MTTTIVSINDVEYVSRRQLWLRTWSASMVDDFLGEPDRVVPFRRGVMRLWLLGRVEAAEASREWAWRHRWGGSPAFGAPPDDYEPTASDLSIERPRGWWRDHREGQRVSRRRRRERGPTLH